VLQPERQSIAKPTSREPVGKSSAAPRKPPVSGTQDLLDSRPVPGTLGHSTRRVPRDRLVLFAALTAGTLFRVAAYLERPSFWLDEARLAVDIGAGSFRSLLHSLAYDQAAPPLFLWVEKLAMMIGGANEYALRALPFVAGLLIPIVTYLLALRIAGRGVAVFAAALTALSPALVQYSIQLKPYETDALVCVGLLLAALVESGRRADGGPGPWTAALGAVAVWVSVTVPFVLAAIAVAFWPAGRHRRRAMAATLACWGISFAIAYWWIYRPVAANPYLGWFWGDRLLAIWIPGFWGRAYGAAREVLFTSFVADTFEVRNTPLAQASVLLTVAFTGALAGVGAFRLARTHFRGAVLLAGPLTAALLSSLAGAYPIAARLMLFAVPLLMTLTVIGFKHVAGAGGMGRLAVALPMALVVFAGQLRNVVRAGDPNRLGHIRPAVEFLQRTIRSGEPIYVESATLPAWTFYTMDWARPDTVRLARMAREGSSGGGAFENCPSRGRPIAGDGADLVFPFGRGVELLGIGDGGPFRAGDRPEPPSDPGWAESEARRIRAAAHPTAWLITTSMFSAHWRLDAALRSLGAVRVDSMVTRWAVVARYRFAGDSGAER
jgi:hypothetical protein